MPLLDVSEAIEDEYFSDDCLCTRAVQTMGSDGRALNAPVTLPFCGVVTPASGAELKRIPEGERMSGSISIVTTFVLYSGKSGYSADVVTWNGAAYTVIDVMDYSRFGAGFVQATAALIPLTG
jgi:hypothetical protein